LAGRKKKHKGGHEDGHVDERWLLTYADLITLLMALFMVLWSISSVNISKYEDLQRSLAEAFSGKVAPGGQGIKENGGSESIPTPAENAPVVAVQQTNADSKNKSTLSKAQQKAAAQHEQAALKEVQKEVQQIANEQKLSGKIQTQLTKDGLHIRITTDDLLFDSGSANVKTKAGPLLLSLGDVLRREGTHKIVVQGYTDNVPISGRYRSNWNLSSDRAANVVLSLIEADVSGERLSAAGHADKQPVASNKSDVGRSLNRRVELWLPRLVEQGKSDTSLTDSVFPGP
jgi:chemotaxis protein MotB